MEKRFFTSEEFNKKFANTINDAVLSFQQITASDYVEYSLRKFDFTYVSDNRNKLVALGDAISESHDYTMLELIENEGLYELSAETNFIPVNQDSMVYWALELYILGYKYDVKLAGYSSVVGSNEFTDLSPEKEESYFSLAISDFQKGNLFGAYTHWTNVLKINPNEANSYYSRAIVKNKLYLWKDALRDYDKAIELVPSFVDAIYNRASIKTERGDREGAIIDFEKVLSLEPIHERASEQLRQLK